ncbi:MAG: hypothetical protein JSU93_00935 [Methanobacteriota archaeon]|nr:MAG: hypothetical protein JSU93_00935 [Euryarchaeota archaeon]
MDLTWDVVGETFLFAAFIAILIGLGRAFIALVVLERNTRRGTGALHDKDVERFIASMATQGGVDVLVGVGVILVLLTASLLSPGFIDGEGRGILAILGLIFFSVSAIVLVAAGRFTKKHKRSK